MISIQRAMLWCGSFYGNWVPVWKAVCRGFEYQDALHLWKHSREEHFFFYKYQAIQQMERMSHTDLLPSILNMFSQRLKLIYFIRAPLQLTRSGKCHCMLNHIEWVYQSARNWVFIFYIVHTFLFAYDQSSVFRKFIHPSDWWWQAACCQV